ncbi:hypothetical protein SAMN04515618_107158 [Collimonas sp. OK307]|nr:hypothetical protein SAMN04515618_107158 [Collimonas sp. OK307]
MPYTRLVKNRCSQKKSGCVEVRIPMYFLPKHQTRLPGPMLPALFLASLGATEIAAIQYGLLCFQCTDTALQALQLAACRLLLAA